MAQSLQQILVKECQVKLTMWGFSKTWERSAHCGLGEQRRIMSKGPENRK